MFYCWAVYWTIVYCITSMLYCITRWCVIGISACINFHGGAAFLKRNPKEKCHSCLDSLCSQKQCIQTWKAAIFLCMFIFLNSWNLIFQNKCLNFSGHKSLAISAKWRIKIIFIQMALVFHVFVVVFVSFSFFLPQPSLPCCFSLVFWLQVLGLVSCEFLEAEQKLCLSRSVDRI